MSGSIWRGGREEFAACAHYCHFRPHTCSHLKHRVRKVCVDLNFINFQMKKCVHILEIYSTDFSSFKRSKKLNFGIKIDSSRLTRSKNPLFFSAHLSICLYQPVHAFSRILADLPRRSTFLPPSPIMASFCREK